MNHFLYLWTKLWDSFRHPFVGKCVIICLFVAATVESYANVPFEKNGKWGLRNEATGKTIIKEKYNSLEVGNGDDQYVVTYTKVNNQQVASIINSKSKKLLPSEADSIKILNDGYLVFNTRKEEIPSGEGTRIFFVPYELRKYDNNLNLIGKIDAQVEEFFPGGMLLQPLTIKRNYSILEGKQKLYNYNLQQVSHGIISILSRTPSILLVKVETGHEAIYSINTMGLVLAYYNLGNGVIKDDKGKLGYLNLATGKYVKPEYDSYEEQEDRYNDELAIILYKNDDSGIIIAKDGTITPTKKIHKKKLNSYIDFKGISYNHNEIEFDLNDEGKIILDDQVYDNIFLAQTVDSNNLYYVLKRDGKYGLKKINGDYSLPCVLPELTSITTVSPEYISFSNGDVSYLSDNKGNILLTVDNPDLAIDGEKRGLVYVFEKEGMRYHKGIYSLPLKKWIIPLGQEFKQLKENLFAVTTGENQYNLINNKGNVLITLRNVESFEPWSDYFIKVKTTSNKMGLLNPKTLQWIAKPEYQNDIAWGAGDGPNRRIAIVRKTDAGDEIVVMTVTGKIIAKKIFPYGTSRREIKRFGQQYLHQSYM